LVNATVNYNQTTHDFLFGVGMTSPQGRTPSFIYEELRAAGVNYALPYVTWAITEPTSGSYDWNAVDYLFRPLEMQKLGYTLNGHCLIFLRSSDLPQYVKSMGFEQLKQAISKHVLTLVSHYRGVMTYWTINEPTFSYSDFFKLSQAQWIEIVDTAVRAVRKADPNAKIMVNVPPVDDPEIRYSPHAILDALVNSGVDFDAIGLELYPFFAKVLDANGYPSVEWASAMLDSFGRYAKPIILSEVGISDKPSQEAQAEWLHAFYAMAFEKPFVTGITWYFVDDDPFMPGAGLFPGPNSLPRPIYHALAEVIQERTTKGTARTDYEGLVRIEGFAGDYLIRVDDALRRASFTVHITEGQDGSYTLVFSRLSQFTTQTVSASTATSSLQTPFIQTSSISPSIVETSTEQYLTQVGMGVLVLAALIVVVVLGSIFVSRQCGRKPY
jgi:GH35 family endo-1,4-beta-xylanase